MLLPQWMRGDEGARAGFLTAFGALSYNSFAQYLDRSGQISAFFSLDRIGVRCHYR